MTLSIQQAEAAPALTKDLQTAPSNDELSFRFRNAMRNLASGVSVVTARDGEDVSGLTATSVISLSVDPPTLLVGLNNNSSALPLIQGARRFTVNLLSAGHQGIADTFAGRRGLKGRHRFGDPRWRQTCDAAPYLADALVVAQCEVEEMLHRYSHVLIIGRVVNVIDAKPSEPMVYWLGGYHDICKLPG